MTTTKTKLRDVLTSGWHYYQQREFATEDPQYIPLAHEFEAGLEVLDFLVGEDGELVDDEARRAVTQSLARFKDDVEDTFPLQARLVTSVLDHIANSSCSAL